MKKRFFGIRRASFLGDRNGASAVEFALIAPIFLALMFSILEAGYFFFITSAVDAANAKAARLIRTGQAQGGISRDDFYDEICDIVSKFGNCDEKLTVGIASFNDFSELAADLSNPICRDENDPTIQGAQFDETDYGVQRQIVRIRVCYLHKNLTPGLGLNLEDAGGGALKMISTSIFRNEPFSD